MFNPPFNPNKYTQCFSYSAAWVSYILIILFSWLIVITIFGCNNGSAWTFINISHSIITFYWFHWIRGTPFVEDQYLYSDFTFWEQIDNGMQCTPTRKFFTIVPVFLFLIASYTTDFQNPHLIFNTITMVVIVIIKLPQMHRVRPFDINGDPDPNLYSDDDD